MPSVHPCATRSDKAILPSEMPAVFLEPGTVVGREFVIERELGSGGMGSVFVALQRSTGVRRALKIMRPEVLRIPRMQGRFELEARTGASIPSDHVVQVLTAGIDETLNIPYLAMELLNGEELAKAVKSRGPMGPDMFRVVFEQLCHAVSAAHRMGIVHRDLKPENIFLANPRTTGIPCIVKVLDFGIAKIVAEAKGQSTAAKGTPLWMAPEQTEARTTVSPATDVWALGLIAFYCLTGRSYWVAAANADSSAEAILREMLIEELVPASVRSSQCSLSLPAWFDGWFERCVHRSPDSRFSDAAAMWQAPSAHLGTGTVVATKANGTSAALEPTRVMESPSTEAWASTKARPELTERVSHGVPKVTETEVYRSAIDRGMPDIPQRRARGEGRLGSRWAFGYNLQASTG